MIRNAFIFIALLTCSAAAVAEPSKDKGFYLAGAYGRSIYDEGGSFGSFGDDEDNSYHIAVGYKIFRYLSVEARYANFGSFNFLFENFDVDATSLHVVGIAPFGQSGWEFFGQLGIGTVNRDVRGLGGLDDSAAAGGIGFRWYPMPNFALGIQTDVYVWDDNNDWESSVGATQLSLQVIF